MDHVLRHVCWAKARAASLGLKFGLDIDSFFEENTLQQRVLVAQHQTLVSGTSVSRLQVGKIRLMDSNRLFQLLDVLCATLSESSLCLTVPLLSFFRCCIDRLSATLALRWLSFRGASRGTLLMIGSRGLGVGRSVLLGRVFVIDRHVVRHDSLG